MILLPSATLRFSGCVALMVIAASCSASDRRGRTVRDSTNVGGRLIVFNAGSLARPMRAALDSFAARTGAKIEQEQAGSLETARKLTELGRIPDVIALADEDVFPKLLVPKYVTSYTRFARNRMVLSYTDRSRFAAELTPENWWQIVVRPGVEMGHSNPNLDPAGYRALLVFQLAERHYRESGLARRLEQAVPARNVRPKEVDLLALVQTGNIDYAWEYESVARGAGQRYLTLPSAIDLGTIADSAIYATASVRVMGNTPRDTITIRGAPITYALAIPVSAPHPQLAERFVAFLLSPDGRRILRAEHLDALD